MRFHGRLAAACAAVALGTIGFAAQASAASPGGDAPQVAPTQVLNMACTTTGSSGSSTVSGWNTGPNDKLTIQMTVRDTAADGHHAAIRFKTQGYNGVWHDYAWHSDYNGNGTSITVNTTAQDIANGIFGIGIDVATMEGNTVLHSCEDHWIAG
jgi:hypothetical protein